jgi:phage recombination protein Bet
MVEGDGMSNVAISNAKALAKNLDIAGEPAELVETLKATAFKGTNVSDAQMGALLIVAGQYGLNPWLKEIYAFPDKGGIVPVVGLDGWSRIINSHAQFDGMDFEQDGECCTCIIYRKDRSHPTRVTEWMAECVRQTGPWKSHPRRMLRHKAMIQCARLAFGFVGIFDQDEAERIVEREVSTPTEPAAPDQPTEYPDHEFTANLPKWRVFIESGRKSAGEIIAMIETKGALSEEQKDEIRACEPIDAETVNEDEE